MRHGKKIFDCLKKGRQIRLNGGWKEDFYFSKKGVDHVFGEGNNNRERSHRTEGSGRRGGHKFSQSGGLPRGGGLQAHSGIPHHQEDQHATQIP